MNVSFVYNTETMKQLRCNMHPEVVPRDFIPISNLFIYIITELFDIIFLYKIQ